MYVATCVNSEVQPTTMSAYTVCTSLSSATKTSSTTFIERTSFIAKVGIVSLILNITLLISSIVSNKGYIVGCKIYLNIRIKLPFMLYDQRKRFSDRRQWINHHDL